MLIMRSCWTRRGLRKFCCEVNAALANGWKLECFDCFHGFLGLRYIFVAEFSKEN